MKKLLFLLVLIPLIGFAEVSEDISRSYEYPEISALRLSNVNGEIKISTWKENRVRIDAVKSSKCGKDSLEKLLIRFDRNGSQLQVEVEHPRNGNGCSLKVDFEITVPESFDLQRVSSVNGGISVTGVSGTIKLQATNGGLLLRECRGELALETVNGSIRIADCSGSLRSETVNGSIECLLNKSVKSIEAETVNGSIDIRTDPAIVGKLKLRSVNGGFRIDKDIVLGNISIVSKKFEATLNPQGIPVTLSTVNGSIGFHGLR